MRCGGMFTFIAQVKLATAGKNQNSDCPGCGIGEDWLGTRGPRELPGVRAAVCLKARVWVTRMYCLSKPALTCVHFTVKTANRC